MGLSLSQAAKRVGKSKSTIGRAIESGRMSAARNEDGTFSIDPSELFRLFPQGGPTIPRIGTGETVRNPVMGTHGTGAESDEIKAMKAELAKQGQRTADAEQRASMAEQRAAVAEAKAEAGTETIADLRTRLDKEGEDRRRITAILTDQSRSAAPQTARQDTPRPWYRRFLG